jgi:hypothetical protein
MYNANDKHFIRFEVFTAVNMSMLVFQFGMLCELVGRYQHFGETMVSTYKYKQCYDPEDQHQQMIVSISQSGLHMASQTPLNDKE